MWIIGEYEAVTLFSLRLSTATSSGGKTLLVPTPYAIKVAVLDIACRTLGVRKAEALWPEIRDLRIALRPAEKAVVTNLFQKVLKPYKNPPKPGIPDFGPFQRTIGYREYVHMFGTLGIAMGWEGEERKEWLVQTLLNMNYLGKRGGFMQLRHIPEFMGEVPSNYIEATRSQAQFLVHGTLQLLDDCGPELTFMKVNIFSHEKAKPGVDRVVRNIVLPYRLTRSSKSFSLYERFDP